MTLRECEQCHEPKYAPDMVQHEGKLMCPRCHVVALNGRIDRLLNILKAERKAHQEELTGLRRDLRISEAGKARAQAMLTKSVQRNLALVQAGLEEE